MKDDSYFVYILLCADGTFYTGTSNDVKKRVKTHNSGKGAKYTKTRRPVKLLYTEKLADKSAALKREAAIKKLTRPKKEELLIANGISW
ncbi:GIY-YIG nuclease family protein [Companilactobacillus sp.]|jgi:putative endonuclease|uniref:GIY-YIG nuclease family protein n=1 Tax=Companilactobacillus sp. TaxID=2767905 RepID=UPI0025BA504D|nr:GIY-YIG nuclease family protein [Companilactobacillus sp.]MCH4008074.1 GIY-YIG nuclease family protein [Companilactobacillus sp.]MCH4051747.1 GIY-YIG nuclease family protein [Companilactobacillus sp.]MCH4076017.1 GIY-YIG nuclease family protein [Companilactobacillus sp.]MCH4124592.1 GIY-YIG nuclease family protein [Companilactobacillus sp.]MCH4132445.1 GIY-YIG nuclease family protein [Companilactobacillus sp.]